MTDSDYSSGKEGLGRKRRAVAGTPSNTTGAENQKQEQERFVQRSQQMYQEKRSEARLANARKTLRALDDKAGVHVLSDFHCTSNRTYTLIQDNYLTIDTLDPDSFPAGWYPQMRAAILGLNQSDGKGPGSVESRLSRQLVMDRLTQEKSDDSDDDEGLDGADSDSDDALIKPELRQSALQFLSSPVCCSPFFR